MGTLPGTLPLGTLHGDYTGTFPLGAMHADHTSDLALGAPAWGPCCETCRGPFTGDFVRGLRLGDTKFPEAGVSGAVLWQRTEGTGD